MKKYLLTNQRWNAIISNDNHFDGNFYYGVTTTKIFCKPSCSSKNPNKDNVKIFKTASEAVKMGFRPCKRCHPAGIKLSDNEWILQIESYLKNNFKQKITLNKIAEDCHSSPYYLQRTFKKIVKKTPLSYLSDVRLNYAKELLTNTNLTINNISLESGFSSDTYFMTFFKKELGLTPSEYRKKVKGAIHG
ncbi:bifunctional transcriptional activator/DNA repair enzyme AdaA [Companilactobacillus baiquanensis]|uniref:Bifunctional transcriptional activator/DNA repair enzyme AdaA n=1 Tax=Companilactobacillus baiquanensis TaxID=2486005 RepID=A0ABW1UY85_9LACO|nr:Ada metal-binding domain-containing protein [Companilactobacillus baiquanensis]